MPKTLASLTMLVVCTLAGAANAHHSFAMFDSSRVVTIEGTVQEFNWSNPHVWLDVIVPGAKGDERWGMESGAPGQMSSRGWRADSLKPGDKIQVALHPMRDGSIGGQRISVVLPNGQTLGEH